MPMESSRELVKAYLRRADKALASAKILLEHDKLEDSASRAYYAIFHAAQAILTTKGLRAKSHKGVRILFEEHIIKKGIMSEEFHDYFDEAFDLRQLSDYEAPKTMKKDQVKDIVIKAEKFVNAVRDLIKIEY